MVTRKKPSGSSSTRRGTASRPATRTSGAATRRRTASRTRRRTTGRTTTRRRTPRTSTTLGSAVALALIALFTQASWPVRIGIVVVALVAAGGYLVVRARREPGDDEPEASPDEPDGPDELGASPAALLDAPSEVPVEAPPEPSSPAPTEPKDSPS